MCLSHIIHYRHVPIIVAINHQDNIYVRLQGIPTNCWHT